MLDTFRTFLVVATVTVIGLIGSHEQLALAQVPTVGQHKQKVYATDFEALLNSADIQLAAGSLLGTIEAWLTTNFDLPPTGVMPKIEFVPPVKIAALHYRGFLTDRGLGTASSDQSAPLDQNEIMAIYVDATNTIYLPEGWTGQTPMELSVLVHEMVHHLQSIAGLRYECRQAREKLAFLAQDRWLDLFGQSLGSAFGIDPFTLLVRTRCM